MLTYEALIDQAKLKGIPQTKARGILREYLQILILKEIYRTKLGKKLYFTGGTYLRLVHNLKRFSEDLDFNTNSITNREFELLLQKVKNELKRVGLELQVTFAHWQNIYLSKLIFHGIEKAYNVVSKYSKKAGIIIKVETNKPKWNITTETEVISGFGELYPCICTERGTLFADKIDALCKKSRGRHLFDIMFMITNKYPINRDILKVLGIVKDPREVITERVKEFSKNELKKQAENLRPCLFDETEAELVLNAHKIIPVLINKCQS
ncbi:MAG: nucleotidyl transferase AbiEii/AbiGii toxin family protein [Candidatus Omnitrophota bacterium]